MRVTRTWLRITTFTRDSDHYYRIDTLPPPPRLNDTSVSRTVWAGRHDGVRWYRLWARRQHPPSTTRRQICRHQPASGDPCPRQPSVIRRGWGLDATELLTKESAVGGTNLHFVLVCISVAHFQHKKTTKVCLRFYLLFCIILANESSSSITNYRYFWRP